ncbi:hypothetical protein EYC84_007765 [Monilinia fructicola]|uniref:Uncharacterized protein n=1 Tax=Monilinia fructicola TaxID=38448 RepID=A0A5M9JK62_MONFR|nr:hypothetical protein EYC84_007765 [Monilinia fructicola]
MQTRNERCARETGGDYGVIRLQLSSSQLIALTLTWSKQVNKSPGFVCLIKDKNKRSHFNQAVQPKPNPTQPNPLAVKTNKFSSGRGNSKDFMRHPPSTVRLHLYTPYLP